VRFKVQ
jgi:hypothetical protein